MKIFNIFFPLIAAALLFAIFPAFGFADSCIISTSCAGNTGVYTLLNTTDIYSNDIFISDQNATSIWRYNKTLNNQSSALLAFPAGVLATMPITNSSNTGITDVWAFSQAAMGIIHFTGAGAYGNSEGNFSLLNFNSSPTSIFGLMTNDTNRSLGTIVVIDGSSPSRIMFFNSTGSNTANSSISYYVNGRLQLSTNASNVPISTFLLSRFQEGILSQISLPSGVNSSVDTGESPRAATAFRDNRNINGFFFKQHINDGGCLKYYEISGYPPESQDAIINTTYASSTYSISMSARIRDSCSLQNATIETNQSGVWANLSNSPTNALNGLSTSFYNVNFSFSPPAGCERVVSYRIGFNNTAGLRNTTSQFNLPSLPLLLHSTSSGIVSNISSCVNGTHAQLSAAQSGRVNLTVAMPLRGGGNITECGYRTSGANRVRYVNQSSYCEVVINYTNASGTASISIVDSSISRTATPGGLPAAIGAATISAIIVLYTYVRTRRKT